MERLVTRRDERGGGGLVGQLRHPAGHPGHRLRRARAPRPPPPLGTGAVHRGDRRGHRRHRDREGRDEPHLRPARAAASRVGWIRGAGSSWPRRSGGPSTRRASTSAACGHPTSTAGPTRDGPDEHGGDELGGGDDGLGRGVPRGRRHDSRGDAGAAGSPRSHARGRQPGRRRGGGAPPGPCGPHGRGPGPGWGRGGG